MFNIFSEPFSLKKYYTHRLVRLWPGKLAVSAIAAFSYYWPSGPVAKPGLWVFKDRTSCKKWWWSSALSIQNYVNPFDMVRGCVPYLAI